MASTPWIDLHRRAGAWALPRPVAFVLSGGAAAGAVQVGVLRALVEMGVTPDLVVGSSVGALNGAMVAAEPVDAPTLLGAIWSRFADPRPGSGLRRRAVALRARRQLATAEGVAALLRQHRPADRIEELELPFAAIATDTSTGQAVTLRRGDLVPALLASVAVPGYYPSVDVGGRFLMDGGVAATLPLRQAVALGARTLVVLDAGAEPHGRVRELARTGRPTDLGRLLLRNQVRTELAAVPDDLVVVYPPPVVPASIGPFDFAHADELVRLGHRSARRFLDGLVLTGPGLYGGPSTPSDPIDLDAPTVHA